MARNGAVAVGGDFKLADVLSGVVGGDHVLAAVFDPLDGTAELDGGEGDDEVLGVELASDAEATTDVALDEVDAVLGHLEEGGEDATVEVWDFGLAPDGEFLAAWVIGGEKAAGLHGDACVAVAAELLTPGVFGIAKGCVNVAEANGVFGGNVGAVLLMEEGTGR